MGGKALFPGPCLEADKVTAMYKEERTRTFGYVVRMIKFLLYCILNMNVNEILYIILKFIFF